MSFKFNDIIISNVNDETLTPFGVIKYKKGDIGRVISEGKNFFGKDTFTYEILWEKGDKCLVYGHQISLYKKLKPAGSGWGF